MRKHVLIVLGIIVLIGIGVVTWLAWPDKARLSVDQVAGRVPTISAPREQTIPTVDIAKPIGWANGAKPSVAPGLAIQPFASGLDHPRWLYQLPNGDVLVAETNSPPRPSSGIVQRVMNFFLGRAGAAVPSANRITLLRDTNGDGVADVKTPFMTGLNSPFGMVLFDGQLYIADTDALVRVPYRDGETKITAKPEKVVPLPPGAITGRATSSRRATTRRCSCRSVRPPISPRTASMPKEPRGHPAGLATGQELAHLCGRPAQSNRHGAQSGQRAAVDRGQ